MNQQTLFDFLVTGLPRDLFRVTRVDGEEEISKPYRFEVELVSDDPDLDFDDAIGKAATLVIGRFGQERRIHGVVAEFTQSRARQGRSYEYRAVLVPRLWLMSLGRTNQVYGAAMPMSFPDIVAAKIAAQPATDLGPDYFELRLSGSYPLRDHVAQYDESDLAFISRLMEHLGIFYFFEQGETKERMIIGDSNLVFPPVHGDRTLDFRPGGGLTADDQASVVAFQGVGRQVPRSVLLKDYNYRLPNVPLLAEATVDAAGFGRVTEYNDHFRTPEEGVALAKIRAEELQARRVVYLGDSHDIHLEAGHGFALAGHFRDGFNRTYVATKVQHTGAQQPDAAGAPAGEEVWTGYRCSFEAIAETVPFRPERVTPWPKLSGIMHSHVDGQGSGDRAEIDEQGRYKVAVPFDVSGVGAMAGSQYMRMAQPHAGSQQGMHFPLRKDTEVVWACIDGDSDRPIILGAVPNPMTPSPVTGRNHTMNVLQTASGIRMEMNDGPAARDDAGPSEFGASGASGGGALGNTDPVDDQTTGGSVWHKVVVTSTDPNHYFRVGDPDTGAQREIDVAADTDRHPPGSLTGWFEWTAGNYVQTVGLNVNRKVSGSAETNVTGTVTHTANSYKIASVKRNGGGGDMTVTNDGNYSQTIHGSYSQKITSGTPLSMQFTYKLGDMKRSVAYSLAASYSYQMGDKYSYFAGLSLNASAALQATSTIGGGLTVNQAYNASHTGGGTISFVDTHNTGVVWGEKQSLADSGSIVATSKVILTVDPVVGAPLLAASQGLHTAAKVWSLATQAAQGAITISDMALADGGSRDDIAWADSVVDLADLVGAGAMYAADAIGGKALFAGIKGLKETALATSPTIVLDGTGVLIACGATTTLRLDYDGVTIIAPRVEILAPEINSMGEWTHEGMLSVTGDVQVAGEMNVTGNVSIEGSIESGNSSTGASESAEHSTGENLSANATAASTEQVNALDAASENGASLGGAECNSVQGGVGCV